MKDKKTDRDYFTESEWDALCKSAHQLGHLWERSHPGCIYDEKTMTIDYSNDEKSMDLYDKERKYDTHKLPMMMFIEPTFTTHTVEVP